MSRLSTIIDVIDLGVDLAQLKSINDLRSAVMRQEGETAAVKDLRNTAFSFKQSMLELAEDTSTPAAIRAANVSIAKSMIASAGVSPEALPDLADKEYLSAALKLADETKRKALSQLSANDRIRTEHICTQIDQMIDLEPMIDAYAHYQHQAKNLLPVTNALGVANAMIAVSAGVFVVSIAVIVNGGDPMSQSTALATLHAFACFSIFFAPFFFLAGLISYGRQRAIETRARTDLQNIYSYSHLDRLEAAHGSLENARQDLENMKNEVASFFADFGANKSNSHAHPIPLCEKSKDSTRRPEIMFDVQSDDGQIIHMKQSEVEDFLASGELDMDTLIKRSGSSDWVLLRTLVQD